MMNGSWKSLMAQRLKNFNRVNLAWKFQSRLKISIPEAQNSPRKIGVWWVARLKFSISLEHFKILNFFNLWALRDKIAGASGKLTSSSGSSWRPLMTHKDSPLKLKLGSLSASACIACWTLPWLIYQQNSAAGVLINWAALNGRRVYDCVAPIGAFFGTSVSPIYSH